MLVWVPSVVEDWRRTDFAPVAVPDKTICASSAPTAWEPLKLRKLTSRSLISESKGDAM